MRARGSKLSPLPPDQTGPVEGRDYVTAIFGPDGQRLTTIPLPEKGCDRDASWGRDDQERVIAPFGIGLLGLSAPNT